MTHDRFHTVAMKANRRSRRIFVLAAASLATLASACSDGRVVPTPTPSPTWRSPPPAPPPAAPALTPSFSPPATSDWRDKPATPGDWSWGMEAGRSVARFAGTLALRCDRASGTITLLRAGTATAPEPMTVTTSSGVRTLSAVPEPGAPPVLAVTLRAGDPLLDAMVFSRGRFAVEVPGLPTLYVPSWPEVSRVVEDCR